MTEDGQKQLKLIVQLLVLTRQRKVQWSGTADDGIYMTTVGEHILRVGTDDDGGWLTVFDANGDPLELIWSGIFPKNLEHNAGRALRQLATLARRIALGIDEVLDSILEQLPEPDKPEEEEDADIPW